MMATNVTETCASVAENQKAFSEEIDRLFRVVGIATAKTTMKKTMGQRESFPRLPCVWRSSPGFSDIGLQIGRPPKRIAARHLEGDRSG